MRATNQALGGRAAAGVANHAHGFDEIADMAGIVTYRRRFDIDVLFAARRLVQMQDAPGLAVSPAIPQGAGFASLVAWHREMVGHLITESANRRLAAAEFLRVGLVGGDDAVIGIHDDAWLGKRVEEGHQFMQVAGRWVGHSISRFGRKCHKRHRLRRVNCRHYWH
jgi:hypothetical protein